MARIYAISYIRTVISEQVMADYALVSRRRINPTLNAAGRHG
jgi:hypothetical protein